MGVIDVVEKVWCVVMGGVGGGLFFGFSSIGFDGKSRNWLEDKDVWVVVVERIDELVLVFENYGEEVFEIGGKWKGKVWLVVRSVMGKGKEVWEDMEGWDRFKGLLEGLK